MKFWSNNFHNSKSYQFFSFHVLNVSIIFSETTSRIQIVVMLMMYNDADRTSFWLTQTERLFDWRRQVDKLQINVKYVLFNNLIRSWTFLKRRVELLFLMIQKFRKQIFELKKTFSNFRMQISRCKSTRITKSQDSKRKQMFELREYFFVISPSWSVRSLTVTFWRRRFSWFHWSVLIQSRCVESIYISYNYVPANT